MTKTIVALYDVHGPRLSPPARLAMEYVKATNPDVVIIGGDFIDLPEMNRKATRKDVEGVRLVETINSARSIVEELRDHCKKMVYIEGNHEYWLREYELENPAFSGLLKIKDLLRLAKMKVSFIPFVEGNQRYQIGQLNFIHGWYCNLHHAKKHLEWAGANVVYGHTHAIQQYGRVSAFKGAISAWNVGCLCELNPSWKRGLPTQWENGFPIVHMNNSGAFNLLQIRIIKTEKGFSMFTPEGEEVKG